MANEDLRLTPHKAGDAWWYEEPQGIAVYIDGKDGRTVSANISWKALDGAIKRKRK